MTALALLRFEFDRWRARRICRREGHPGVFGDYPPTCTRCGVWVR